MDFLTIIFIILVIYVSVRLIFRYYGVRILSWLSNKAIQRFERKIKQQTNQYNNQSTNNTSNSKPKTKSKEIVGEYVDFEEID